jgi:hypothetical protein
MRWHTIFTIGIAGILLAAGALAMSANSLWEKQFDRGSSDAARDIVAEAPRVLAVGPPNAVGHSDSMSAEPLWENQFNRGSSDSIRGMVVEGPRVFAVGPTNAVANPDKARDIGIVAYDAKDGAILWERHFDFNYLNDEPWAVAKAPRRIFVAGYTQAKKDDADFSVLAYDSEKGDLLWQSHLDGVEGARQGLPDQALDIAVAGDRVFAVGYTTAGNLARNFTIRAYDANYDLVDGDQLLWERVYTRTGTAAAVATDGINVYAVGRTILSLDQAPRLPENRPDCANDGDWKDWTVVAYDLNGNFKWDDTYRRPDAYSGAEAIAVVAAEGRVFVGGNTFVLEDGKCNGDFSVVAYNAADGTRVWWDNYDDPAGGRDGMWALTVLGGRVFAAGETTTTHLRGSQTLDWLVRAYDAEGDGTGNPRPLWTDIYETDAGDDHAARIAASGGKVFVAGSTVRGQSDANASHPAWLVRAYDAGGDGAWNARLLWQNLWDEPGGGEAAALVVYGSSVFVGGAVVPVAIFGDASNPYVDFGVRAYQR